MKCDICKKQVKEVYRGWGKTLCHKKTCANRAKEGYTPDNRGGNDPTKYGV